MKIIESPSNKLGSKYLSEFIKPLMHHILVVRSSQLSPLVEAMGSATSSISPERDLLDLHGRVAIVTGAKYVIPRIDNVLFCADQVCLFLG